MILFLAVAARNRTASIVSSLLCPRAATGNTRLQAKALAIRHRVFRYDLRKFRTVEAVEWRRALLALRRGRRLLELQRELHWAQRLLLVVVRLDLVHLLPFSAAR